MFCSLRPCRVRAILCGLFLITADLRSASAQQQPPPPRFGGAYSALDARRQRLVDDWLARFAKTTGKTIAPGVFYDDILGQSAKTTFEAVTHALMTSTLTDRSAVSLGDALALVERVEAIQGEVAGAPSDRQFRMYVRLRADALATLSRSQQFKRGADNSIYHKGFPISYRAQGGTPSIQISVALDRRRADIDVDYRTSSFPISLFNGHLTASNSDVRAGSNYDRHLNRWTGLQNWWRNFFGVPQERAPEGAESDRLLTLPTTPRAGKKTIDVMVNDFLQAWLVEGNVAAAMSYVSPRSYACLAQDLDNPSDFDRGLARFQLMADLKSSHDVLGPHASLDGLIVGTRLVTPALRVVRQPHHAQFVIYSVPDDVAASFDCESRLTPGDPKRVARVYGNYFGATFYIDGRRDYPVALLWAREDGYWKIASWRVGADESATPLPDPVPEPAVARVNADATFAQAARGFLESWLVRKDYNTAFGYLSRKAYSCYDLERGPEAPASNSLDDAGQRLRTALELSSQQLGPARNLDAILSAAEPVHPAIRVMNHPLAGVFSLSSLPDAFADATECAARAEGSTVPEPLPLEYGNGFGMTVRFKTRSGDAPVLGLLWRRESGDWRITSYVLELP